MLRPGVLVEENELPMAVAPADVFRLRWTGASVDGAGTVPMAKLQCEIRYETAGTAGQSGMDRGRLLTAMDAEVAAVLAGATQNAARMDFSGGTAVPDGTRIFWSDPVFGALVTTEERLSRVVQVDVWSLEGAGDV